MNDLVYLYNQIKPYLVTIGISWAGIFAVLTYWLKNGGNKWIESKIDIKFSKDLESHKHRLNKDLEEYKALLSSKASLTTKQKEKETEILAKLWELLKNAEGAMTELLKVFKQYNNVQNLPLLQFERLLKQTNFDDTEIEDLIGLTGKDRQTQYQKMVDFHKYTSADKAKNDLHNFNLLNKPFIQKLIFEKVSEITHRYNESLIDYQVGTEAQDHKMKRGAFKVAFPENDKLIDQIGDLIYEFIHS